MTNSLFYIVFLLFGLAAGSFLNVLIIRLPQEESILGRSHCPKCKKQIAAVDLIPILSYIFLWGRCRNCHEPISFQYLLVELSTGLLFVLGYYLLGLNYLLIFYFIFLSALVAIFVYDLKYLEIPEAFSWLLLISAVFFSLLSSNFSLQGFLLGGLVGGGILGILVGISDEKMMGAGDIKIGLAFGFLLGYPKALLFLFLAFIIGAIIGALLILFGGKKLKSEVAFAPFLIIAGLITLIWGDAIIKSYLSLILL